MAKGWALQGEYDQRSAYERIRRAWRAAHRDDRTYRPMTIDELVQRHGFTPISAQMFLGCCDALNDTLKRR